MGHNKYTITNIKYMVKNWVKWEKKSLLYAFIRIPSVIVLPALTALVPKVLIDCITNRKDSTYIIFVTAVLSLLIASLSWISPYMYEKFVGCAQIVNKKYGIQLFEKILKVKYQFIETLEGRNKLEKAKCFNRDYFSPCVRFGNCIVMFCANFLGIFSYLFILNKLNKFLLIIVLVTCFIEFLLILLGERFFEEKINSDTKLGIKLNYYYSISQNLSAEKDIKIYNFNSRFIKILDGICRNYILIQQKFVRQVFTVGFFRSILSFIRDCCAYFYLIFLVKKQLITISDFVFMFGILMGFSSWILGVSDNIKDIKYCCKECQNYREFIELDNDISNHNHNQNKIEDFHCLKLKDINYKYVNADSLVLNNISMEINNGEKIAIVGENGAGKTTLVKIISGLYKQNTGDILVNNIKSNLFDENEYKSLFSIVYQDFHFLPMSIEENICLCSSEEINKERLYNVLQEVGMYDKIINLPNGTESKMIKQVHNDAVQFSGGELQRLLIARALYRDSKILIFDEPTAALDPVAEDELYRLLNKVAKYKTIIFISHRLSSTKFCDKIAYISDGKIIEFDTHDNLMKLKGKYYKLYMLQSYYYREYIDEEFKI